MILSVAIAIAQQASGSDFLVVDGLVVGMHTNNGWSKANTSMEPFIMGLNQVGMGTIQMGATTVRFAPNTGATALVAQENMPTGVFYSGKVSMPRTSRTPLQRSASLASAAQFARLNGVGNPRPYLLNVFEVSVDDSGKQYELISATSRPPVNDYPQAEDWEAVLVRWKYQQGEKVVSLSSSFPKDGQNVAQCRLRAVGDFDGDGQVEFLTTSTQPSLMTTTLWSFRDGKLTPVLDVSYEITT